MHIHVEFCYFLDFNFVNVCHPNALYVSNLVEENPSKQLFIKLRIRL
jgi:hypothetical protein